MAKIKAKLLRDTALLTWYEREFLRLCVEYGGIYNGHAHIDRAHTLEDIYLRGLGISPLDASSKPLTVKQNLVGNLHDDGPAYTEENLRQRMSWAIERQIAFGVTRLDTNIDATPDLPEDGLLAIRVALELKEKYRKLIKIRIAPTPIFGFKTDPKDELSRWEVFAAAARQCDYLSLLPEKDDFSDPAQRDGKVGFKHHIRMGMELACELKKEVQFHLDQANWPGERGTERFFEILEGLPQPKLQQECPVVWIIHEISPGAYAEDRFARLVDRHLEYNGGVIPCGSAGASMRQIRSVAAPTHNCIARIPEYIKRKVPQRLGTDNIEDVFVPASDGDMLTEVKILANLVRLPHPHIWAKLACGVPLNNVDIALDGTFLYEDRKACLEHNSSWKASIE